LVVDPFAGGGAIPLEALRVGADAFATDLNPVAVLINKVVLQYVPKYGEQLAEEARKWCGWAQKRAYDELSAFYPSDPDGSVPVAFLWARKIACEGPGCGATVPLMRSFWLARKGRRVALLPTATGKQITFAIVHDPDTRSIPSGTIARGSVTCPCCGFTTPVASVRKQLSAVAGGSDNALLYAVVVDSPSNGRQFRLPVERDLAAANAARRTLAELDVTTVTSGALPLVPTEPLPPDGTLGFRVQKYGMVHWRDVFNSRQLLALSTYARLARDFVQQIPDPGLAEAVNACIALIVDRLADLNAALCVWQLNTPNTAHVFGRWALPMNWDYGEVNPLAGAGGSPESAVRRMTACVSYLASANMVAGHVEQASATRQPLPNDVAAAFVTDPPYYDAMPYSDLLDFFYVWLKRCLEPPLFELVMSEIGPKDDECIVDPVRGKDRAFYESIMQQAMAEGRRVLAPSGLGVVVFAHKSTSGWEALLQSVVDAGFTVTASWPIDTEMGSRLRAKASAALASSVHLVCRPRENPDGSIEADSVGDWRAVLRELPLRIHEWMPRLAREGVVGADAIFACLGPALEIFSRYSRVEKASGESVELREYLEQVWAAVAHEALSMIFEDADATGLEGDARLTAMWLWTLSTSANGGNGGSSAVTDDEGDAESENDDEEGSGKAKPSVGFSLEFDAARKIAQGLGAHLEDLGSVVEIKGDQARLLSVAERTHHLFGKDQAQRAPARRTKKLKQLTLFEELEAAETDAGWGGVGLPPLGETTLDRVHQAMILFAAGRGEAFKRFLVEEGVGRAATFWKLAQSLSALYPAGTDEKRWVDGVLARKKGLGFG
jgi:adenine-specific DNA methylase